jgi:regulator of sigma E protease
MSGLPLAILALGFLIVVHEAGHYFVARWCRMRVERFSIGFGPGILKKQVKSGTTFQLAPIPFGGFVEIRGMNIAEEVDPEDVHAYPNRPAWQRFLTILAGPATNYLSAIVLAFLLYTCHGQPGSTFYIDSVKDGYDAQGKLVPGDRVVAVDGTPMYAPSGYALSKAINAKQGAAIDLTVWRDYQLVTITLQPKLATDKDGKPQLDDKGKQQYLIGVVTTVDIVDVGVVASARDAFVYPVIQTKVILGGLRDIFTGKEDVDPGGPVRIVKEFNTAFERGFADGIRLLMLLSVYLGLFNLFPLPALDGGRLVFLGYEMVTRRRANPKIETMVHMAGIMLLMIVMILVTLNDFNLF